MRFVWRPSKGPPKAAIDLLVEAYLSTEFQEAARRVWWAASVRALLSAENVNQMRTPGPALAVAGRDDRE